MRFTSNQDKSQKVREAKTGCSLPDALMTLNVEEVITPDEVRHVCRKSQNPNLQKYTNMINHFGVHINRV